MMIEPPSFMCGTPVDFAADVGGGLLQRGLMQVDQHDLRALVAQKLRRCSADAAGTASDHADLVLHLASHRSLPLLQAGGNLTRGRRSCAIRYRALIAGVTRGGEARAAVGDTASLLH